MDKKPENYRDKEWLGQALRIFARYSAWIAGPVVIGTILGNWLDIKYNGGQLIFFGTIGIAFIISITGLVIEASQEYKKIENENKNKNIKDEKNRMT